MARNLYDSLESMKRDGTISQETVDAFRRGPNRTLEAPSLARVRHDPEFVCVLLDQSGSMQSLRRAVIRSQPLLLNPLRSSAKCRHQALFVGQYMFAASPTQLHSFKPLSPDGNDDVTILSEGTYHPGGQTALYQTVYWMLQDSLMMADHCLNSEGLIPQFSIAVVTDGEDNLGGVDPGDIRRFLDEMRRKSSLRRSVVIGLLGDGLSAAQLEATRSVLGFDDVIQCGATSEREIRRAFQLGSQSIADAM